MMDDAVLQQSLSQIDPFFWFAYLPNFFQPTNELTGKKKRSSLMNETSFLFPLGKK